MNIFDFQDDLRNGMSLDDALVKHDLTLEKAFNMLCQRSVGRPAKARHDKPRYIKTGHKYIGTQNGNRFYIRKIIDGKWTTFGSYSTLADAIKVRDMCIKHGWIQTNVDGYCREVGVVRRWDKRRKQKVRYH